MITRAIINARIIDGTGAAPIEDATLIIEGERIAAVGPSDDVAAPNDAQIIDASGTTVLPGLIDAHMHVGWGFGPIRRLQECLRRGTTTVADVTGGPGAVKLREAIEQDVVRGCPRYHVGCVVGCTFGHLHREDDRVAGVDADGPWEVRRGVRQMVQAGADFIKTASSGGFQWATERVDQRNYTLQELVACGMTPMQAIEAGTRVAAEALGIEALTGTLEAGKRADLQIVRGDPLSDIAILEDASAIAMVLRDGRAPLAEMAIQ
jgi:imidazolonepropionase-like amidohydrolase